MEKSLRISPSSIKCKQVLLVYCLIWLPTSHSNSLSCWGSYRTKAISVMDSIHSPPAPWVSANRKISTKQLLFLVIFWCFCLQDYFFSFSWKGHICAYCWLQENSSLLISFLPVQIATPLGQSCMKHKERNLMTTACKPIYNLTTRTWPISPSLTHAHTKAGKVSFIH